MRSVWLIISTLAIANLLGLAGFVGWLHSSDRINTDRLRKIREMLSVTIADEQKALDEAKKKDEEDAKAREAAKRMEGAPESAAEKIERVKNEDDVRQQTAVRLRREIDDLRRQLLVERQRLEDDRTALEAKQKAFEQSTAEAVKNATDEQFKQALGTLESQKAKDAQQVLKSLLDAKQEAQVVAYLAAMQERPRGRIMTEFIKEDPKLAATLLERLRARGLASLAAAPPAP